MLYLEENEIALNSFYEEVKPLILRKLARIDNRISTFIIQHVDELVKAKPPRLIELNKIFYDSYGADYSSQEHDWYVNNKIRANSTISKQTAEATRNKYKILKDEILGLINYDHWSKLDTTKGAYLLAKNLGIKTCTYCNRTYTVTLTKNGHQKLMRPQFDHWFSKSKYPLLALSFYNLIPSCSICNSSIKGNIVFKLNTHLHPYLDKNEYIKQKISFKITSDLEYKTSLDLKSSNQRALNTFQAFHLKKTYEAHQSELSDLIKLKKEYNLSYIKILKNLFPQGKLNEKEIYRIVFGTEIEDQDFHKRPFSKLKKDILQELGIIKTI